MEANEHQGSFQAERYEARVFSDETSAKIKPELAAHGSVVFFNRPGFLLLQHPEQ